MTDHAMLSELLSSVEGRKSRLPRRKRSMYIVAHALLRAAFTIM